MTVKPIRKISTSSVQSQHAMIPRSAEPSYQESWQIALKTAVRDPRTLLQQLNLDPDQLPWRISQDHPFPMRVPQDFVELMEVGNPQDPLLLQVLPLREEEDTQPGYSDDPLAEAEFTPVPGLLHKYHGRVLLVTTSACGIHCRYCFRKAFPYNEHRPQDEHWQQTLSYLRADESIEEVIFSGGDPLTMTDKHLGSKLADLEKIEHISTVRIHSRMATTVPTRLTTQLKNRLAESRLKAVLVLHCNHPNELAAPLLKSALEQFRTAGIHLLNQTVLLKQINDDSETLIQLSQKLFDLGVLPYYLHTLDRVSGTHHFAISDEQALQIHSELLAKLPGYLVPKLVREQPSEAHKTPVIPMG